MGACIITKKSKKTTIDPVQEYPRQVQINIKGFQSPKKKSTDQISCTLTEPLQVQSCQLKLSDSFFWVSYCILPGLDPRGIHQKQCQDLCFYILKPRTLLLVLFDGHGEQGKDLVEYCKTVVQFYFEQNYKQEPPETLLTNITLKCDARVKLPINNIDAYFSGTTAVFLMISQGVIYSASVGDSRAILATTEMPVVTPFPEIRQQESKRSDWKISLPLQPIQLTRDQKPEDPDEYLRIINSGGRVQRLQTEDGRKIGPYRVWQFHQDTPGLAMSRSIGDQIGSYIGVIATPITSNFRIRGKDDYFLVIASDGIWDVMTNQEVVNFVEFYRGIARKEVEENIIEEKVKPNTTCIAQLLCEEARQRWFRIVENEDVVIDDISCIVLEMKWKGDESESQSQERKSLGEEFRQRETIEVFFKSPTMKETKIEDPIRSSMILQ